MASTADPKGPVVGADDSAAPAKKASKKAGSKQRVVDDGAPPPAAAATGSAPHVPMLHDVPRIPLAEPKAAVDGDGKPRAAKKRTSTPPDRDRGDGGGGGGGPTSTSATVAVAGVSGPSVPAAASKSEDPAAAEAEREQRARREAKRQRAREQEELKRREELERQAVEDARRRAEQQQREARRQQELAALNANAEDVQEEEEDAYGEEGFENYDDDFESEEAPPPMPKAAPAKAPGSTSKSLGGAKAKGVAVASDAELKKIQQALQAESKELSSSRPSSSSVGAKGDRATAQSGGGSGGAVEAKKRGGGTPGATSSIASSIAGLKQSLDPRAKRVREILDARKLEVESCNLFQQPPLTAVDRYLTQLRRGHIRQAFVQTNEGERAVATQTKAPPCADKAMHFPDDIGIDDASTTKRTAGRRGAKAGSGVGGGRATGPEDDDDGGSNQNELEGDGDDGDGEGGGGGASSGRFFRFLEHASHLCEILVEANTQEAERVASAASKGRSNAARVILSSKSSLSERQVFPRKSIEPPGLEALLRDRPLVALTFSPALSNVLLASYGPSNEEQEEITSDSQKARRSAKSLSCIWDVNQLDTVQFVLKNEGAVTTARLGPHRDLFALAATEDGSIHVWDLRSRLTLTGVSRSPEDPDVQVYAPTYSTCGLDSRSGGSHASSIVALEVVGASSGSGTFQFGSMDDRGVLIVWSVIEFDAGDDALFADKCVEIGGRIKLIVNTRIDTQAQFLALTRPPPKRLLRRDSSDQSSALGSTKKSSRSLTPEVTQVGPIATTMKFFPGDPTQLVVGTTMGLMLHCHRFENSASASIQGSRPTSFYSRAKVPSGGGGSAVTAIAMHPQHSSYFLVGYEDGSITLYRSQLSCPLTIWEEVEFGQSVTSLKWSPSRSSVFYAVYSHGLVLVWDLVTQTYGPVFEYELPEMEPQTSIHYHLALSTEAVRASRPAIAFCAGGEEPFRFQIHELGTAFVTQEDDSDLERVLESIL